MADKHDIGDILSRIDNVIEVATLDKATDTVKSTRYSPLARAIVEATGLDAIVVRGTEGLDGEAAAIGAARSAMEAFLPGYVIDQIQKGHESTTVVIENVPDLFEGGEI